MVTVMFVYGSGQSEQSLQRAFHRCFLLNCGSVGQVDSEKIFFFKFTNLKNELPMATMSVKGSEQYAHSL